jgi:hypothetical protein
MSASETRRRLLKTTDGERSVLGWGGLAGMLGSFLSVVTFVFVGVFEGDEPTLVLGWKFFSLSRHPAGIIDEGETACAPKTIPIQRNASTSFNEARRHHEGDHPGGLRLTRC